jgi:spore maturation protein CgeB
MKIMMVAPKFYNRNIDISYWNFYFSFKTLGHDVLFYDTSVYGGGDSEHFTKKFENFKPDLIFCMPVDDERICKPEPFKEIAKITDSGICNTFAWFSDDRWRFEWSSGIAPIFKWCSTTEPSLIEKFKLSGYDNIIECQWHSNPDFYSTYNDIAKMFDVTFVGAMYGDREESLKYLIENGVDIKVFTGLSFEEMIKTMASSRISISFMRNPNANNGIQMKARPFEIIATNTCLLCEENKDMEKYLTKNQEYISFQNKEQLLFIIKKLLDKPQYVIKIADSAEKRYREEHTSQKRLAKLLEDISI